MNTKPTSHKSSHQQQQRSNLATLSSLISQQPQRRRKCPPRPYQSTNVPSNFNNKMVVLQCGMLLIIQLLMVVTVHAGWIDIDTPVDKRTTISKVDGTVYQLVRWESDYWRKGCRPLKFMAFSLLLLLHF